MADVLSFKKYPANQLLCLSVDPELGQIRKVFFCLFVFTASFPSLHAELQQWNFISWEAKIYFFYIWLSPQRDLLHFHKLFEIQTV